MLQKGGLEGPVFYSSDDDYLRNGLENGPLRYKKKRQRKKKKKKTSQGSYQAMPMGRPSQESRIVIIN